MVTRPTGLAWTWWSRAWGSQGTLRSGLVWTGGIRLGGLGGQTLGSARLRLVGPPIAAWRRSRSKSGDPGCTVGEQLGRQVTAKTLGLIERANGRTTQVDTGILAAGESTQKELSAIIAPGYMGKRADRRGATGFESREKGPLCCHSGAGVRVIQR